ncbi:uncharacterized protein LOC132405071 [Hypanus sabinus]|uniref:uncharacterized protein LOC132405071 n=1 Tax=Hypanus sabinus TaxID=79690 RepID=UPI0028C41D51|nr:uncharacterized protein LOC132405071 [Hypanus sabinus]
MHLFPLKVPRSSQLPAFSVIKTSFSDNITFTIILGDFNQARLKKSLSNYHQQVTCNTRGNNTLDHCYTTIKNAYRAIPHPHFWKSDHLAVLLLPEYRQRLKTAAPAVRTKKVWTREAQERLRDCFESVDWTVFSDSSLNLDEYAVVVTNFIKTCLDECVLAKIYCTFPNQKLWMNQEVRRLLKPRSVAIKSGNPGLYQKTRYDLWRALSKAKRQFRMRLEATSEARQLWQGLQDNTSYKMKHNSMNGSDASLPDELNTFYAWFEQENTATAVKIPAAPDDSVISFSETDVKLSLKRVNPARQKVLVEYLVRL